MNVIGYILGGMFAFVIIMLLFADPIFNFFVKDTDNKNNKEEE